MNIKQSFRKHSIWACVSPKEIQILLGLAEEICYESQAYVTKQYHPANYFYFMYDGSFHYSMQLDKDNKQLSVGKSSRQWTAIGWSGLREPFRYAVTTQCERACNCLRWDRAKLQELLQQYPQLGYYFIGLVLQTGVEILDQSRKLLVTASKQFAPSWRGGSGSEVGETELGIQRILPWMQRSLFFERFDEEALAFLSRKASVLAFQSGDQISPVSGSDGIYMLLSGAVALKFTAGDKAKDSCAKRTVLIRNLDTAGQIVAWSFHLAPQEAGLCAAMSQDTLLCFISGENLDAYVQQRWEFGLTLVLQFLFLTANQLRSTRAQLIQQQFEDECFSVRSLLQQASPQLSVTSPLHSVPHLLANRLTQSEAFRSLAKVKQHGNALEINLASICLDILAQTRQENYFYLGLLKVYETVVKAAPDDTPEQVRQACDAEIANALNHVSYVVDGLENLPDEPGNIVILNHLINHPYNALPNHFELAMDTHFVSAMVLRPKYGDGGVRIVRRPRNEEFGHQDYYNRLGYIYVVTKESDQNLEVQKCKGSQLDAFIDAARTTLHAKRNLVICPEGTSRWSEESPGPFKPGAFILAGSLEPEPLIVPIAVANFDKRLRNTTLAVIVKPPFRISDYVDVKDSEALNIFLEDYRITYKEYVHEAQRLGDSASSLYAHG